MFEDELRDILRDLVRTTRSSGATIVVPPRGANGESRTGDSLDSDSGAERETPVASRDNEVPLGRGAALQLHNAGANADQVPAALERAARALRACARRWNQPCFPATHVSGGGAVKRDRAADRVHRYLEAFANTAGVRNALVTVAGELAASAAPPTELQAERLPFLLKQLANEVKRHRGETSHVELAQPGVVLFAFWIDACLLVFVSDDFAEDFVRHRAKLVMRELAHLLPYLDDDDDPGGGAKIAPLPPTPAD